MPCIGARLPGKIPTPNTAMPITRTEIQVRFPNLARRRPTAAAMIRAPLRIMVALKMRADGCRMMLLGGVVAPRSLISLSWVV